MMQQQLRVHSFALLAVAFVVVFTPRLAAAACTQNCGPFSSNLMPNSTLDSANGWTSSNTGAGYSSIHDRDAASLLTNEALGIASTNSGSILVEYWCGTTVGNVCYCDPSSGTDNVHTATAPTQVAITNSVGCIPVTGSKAYTVGAWLSNQTGTVDVANGNACGAAAAPPFPSTVDLKFSFYPLASCVGSATDMLFPAATVIQGDHAWHRVKALYTSPALAVSMGVSLTVSDSANPGMAVGRVALDDIFVVPGNPIGAPALTNVTNSTLPPAYWGTPYDFTMWASGDPFVEYVFGSHSSGNQGALPADDAIQSAGLSLSPGGELFGKPLSGDPKAAAQTLTLYLDLLNPNGASPVTYALSIVFSAPPAPVITFPAPSLPDAYVGIPYSQTMTATKWVTASNAHWQLSTYNFVDESSVQSATMPTGLALNVSNGKVTGTPAKAGVAVINAIAEETFTQLGTPAAPHFTQDSDPVSASLRVYKLSLPTPSPGPPPGYENSGYAYTVPVPAAYFSPPGYATCALGPGSTLAACNLSLGSATCAIAINGAPTLAAQYVGQTCTGTIVVTGPAGQTVTQPYSITIEPPAVAPVITSAAPPAGAAGEPYAFTVTATGSAPLTFSAAGLPEGLALNASSGVISGTPPASNTSNVTITVTNGAAQQVSQAYTLTIGAAVAATFTNGPPPPTATTGIAYDFTYQVTGSLPVLFTISAGALPDGLTIDAATGQITGVPTTVGVFTGTTSASFSDTVSSAQAFTLTVVARSPPTFANDPIPTTGTVGVPYSATLLGAGTGPFKFTIASGGLPTGVIMSDAGVLTGSPFDTGVFAGTFSVSGAVPPNGTQSFSVTVATPTVAKKKTGCGCHGVASSGDYSLLAFCAVSLSWRLRRRSRSAGT